MQKTELKFNSQVCTTKEQSQRLLELGLKPETADMCIDLYNEDEPFVVQNKIDYTKQIEFIPAWSLHRLMEIAIKGDKIFGVDVTNKNNIDYCYERLICDIEGLINAKAFNKEYLKQ